MAELINLYQTRRRACWTRWAGLSAGATVENHKQAALALDIARGDLAAGKTSYADSFLPCREGVSWQKPERDTPRGRTERLGYVEKPESVGLRHVGNVEAESYGGRNTWSNRDSCGWYTDPYGESCRDGTGLCWGVVYQLPGRGGKARFVAGYKFGGQDGGPCLDFGNVFESDSGEGETSPQEHDDAKDAARTADSMAQSAAEKERDYQTASTAGYQWGEKGEEIATLRQRVKALKTARKAAPRPDKPAISDTIDSILDDIAELNEERKKLASGDADSLCFYTGDKTLQAAFCESAGIKKFPGA